MTRWVGLCRVSALAIALVGVVLLVAPTFYAGIYIDTAEEGAAFMGRRAAPLTLGLALICWHLSLLEVGPFRDAMVVAMVLIWAGFAATGLYEWLNGTAAITILGASAIEMIFAAGFWMLRRT